MKTLYYIAILLVVVQGRRGRRQEHEEDPTKIVTLTKLTSLVPVSKVTFLEQT